MSETDFFGWVSTVTRRWEPYEDEAGSWQGYWCLDHQTDASACPCPHRSEIPNVWPTLTTQDAANIGGLAQAARFTRPLNSLLGGVPNPNWLEWFMGLPLSWTDPESTPEETESYLQWLDAHSYIFSGSWWGIPRLHEIPRAVERIGDKVYARTMSRRRRGLDPIFVLPVDE
jgi:hypothetical protein